jgi:hypothetical protein
MEGRRNRRGLGPKRESFEGIVKMEVIIGILIR